jgi:predicted MarR family transcription regulator
MNDLIPDKQAYQLNKRRMAWTALGMMIVFTIAVLIGPAKMAEADAVLMMMYGSYRHWLVLILASLAWL